MTIAGVPETLGLTWCGPKQRIFAAGEVMFMFTLPPATRIQPSVIAIDPGSTCGWAMLRAGQVFFGESDAPTLTEWCRRNTHARDIVIEGAVDRHARTFDPWPHYVVGAFLLVLAPGRVHLAQTGAAKIGAKWIDGWPRGFKTKRPHAVDALGILSHHLLVRAR